MPELFVADVGNTRIKLGRFGELSAPDYPEPQFSCAMPSAAIESEMLDAMSEFLSAGPFPSRLVVASVNAPAAERLTATLTRHAAERNESFHCKFLSERNVPIKFDVHEPAKVGVDRLCGAVAADRLRRSEKAAIVVGVGTAITVDLLSAEGVFQGGAILPGIGMSARALHEQTHLLPLIGMAELDTAPDAVGKNTHDAMQAGLFWGAVGAIRELIARQRDRLVTPPQVFLTGGAAPSVAPLLGGSDYTVRFMPNLVLSGIAIAARCDGT